MTTRGRNIDLQIITNKHLFVIILFEKNGTFIAILIYVIEYIVLIMRYHSLQKVNVQLTRGF